MDERSVIVNYIAQIWEGDSSSLLRVLYNFALEEQNSCGWRNSMIWRITKMHLRDDAPKVLFSYLQQVFPLTANTVVGLANAAAEIWSAAEWDVNTRDITIPVAQLLHFDTVLLAQSLEALPMCKKALLVDACEHYCNATTAVALLGTTGSSSYITKDSMKLCGSIFFAGVAAAAIGVAAGTTAPIGIAAFGAGNLVAGIGYSAFKWFKPKYDTWMKQDELDEACRTLGVARNSTRKEVDRAYKRKMMDYHPDKGGSAEAACRLSDSKKLLLEHMDEFSS